MAEGRNKSEVFLKTRLCALSEQAVQRVAEDPRPLDYFGGATAVYDLERDQAITELPAFEDARTALGALQVVQERYGPSPDWESVWERLALQFVYGFLGNLSEATFDAEVFEVGIPPSVKKNRQQYLNGGRRWESGRPRLSMS